MAKFIEKEVLLIKIIRVYDAPAEKKEFRVLVDKLWPRGISKSTLQPDLWLKELAPSDDLRKWYHSNPDRWDDFKKKYFSELNMKINLVEDLLQELQLKEEVMFLYSSKNDTTNNAIALKEYVLKITEG